VRSVGEVVAEPLGDFGPGAGEGAARDDNGRQVGRRASMAERECEGIMAPNRLWVSLMTRPLAWTTSVLMVWLMRPPAGP
jgi:hypothetical protein